MARLSTRLAQLLAALLSRVLHDWPDGRARQILRARHGRLLLAAGRHQIRTVLDPRFKKIKINILKIELWCEYN
jgi:hypothetical protein